MSHFISLRDAVEMNSRFRTNKEMILAVAYRNQNILSICESFDRTEFDEVLSQGDCKKLRVYFGMDANYKVRVVIVGVNSNDEDILTSGDEKIIEEGIPCPPSCPPPSPINS